MPTRASVLQRLVGPLCAFALMGVLLPPVAQAQPRDPGPLGAVQALQAGQRVRLDVAPGGRVEGRFVLASDTSLTIVRQDVITQIRLPDVERLWVRGRSTRRGALLGAVAGILAGAAYGFLIGSVACEPVDGGDCTAAEVAAYGGLAGGVGGAAAGAGVGFAIPRWHRRFP